MFQMDDLHVFVLFFFIFLNFAPSHPYESVLLPVSSHYPALCVKLPNTNICHMFSQCLNHTLQSLTHILSHPSCWFSGTCQTSCFVYEESLGILLPPVFLNVFPCIHTLDTTLFLAGETVIYITTPIKYSHPLQLMMTTCGKHF